MGTDTVNVGPPGLMTILMGCTKISVKRVKMYHDWMLFNVSIKKISKHSLGTIINLMQVAGARAGDTAPARCAKSGPWTWKQGCGQEVRRKCPHDMKTRWGLRYENGEARNQ